MYNIAAETGAKSIKVLSTAVEDVEQFVPPGTETAVALLKSAASASQKAIEAARGTAKAAVELAVEPGHRCQPDRQRRRNWSEKTLNGVGFAMSRIFEVSIALHASDQLRHVVTHHPEVA